MIWNEHSKIKGSHAFLSPSNPSWIRYDEEKLYTARQVYYATQCGTLIHELASQLINNRLRITEDDDVLIFNKCMTSNIPKDQIDAKRYMKTLVPYVNDAIHYSMKTEQVLYYNSKCFGTTDAISFENDCLRIHDLKTGLTPAHMDQLYIYASLFCLEYDISPAHIKCELRIYQNGMINKEEPEIDELLPYIDGIRTRCDWLNHYEEGGDVQTLYSA